MGHIRSITTPRSIYCHRDGKAVTFDLEGNSITVLAEKLAREAGLEESVSLSAARVDVALGVLDNAPKGTISPAIKDELYVALGRVFEPPTKPGTEFTAQTKNTAKTIRFVTVGANQSNGVNYLDKDTNMLWTRTEVLGYLRDHTLVEA